jgi:hypothetical protein
MECERDWKFETIALPEDHFPARKPPSVEEDFVVKHKCQKKAHNQTNT